MYYVLSKRYFVNCRGDWVRNTLCEAKGGLGPPHGENLMDEGMGVPGGVVEQIFGSPLTSALLIHSRERCIAYRFPPAPTAEPRRIFRCTAYRFPRRSRGRHRISVRPPLPHRQHL